MSIGRLWSFLQLYFRKNVYSIPAYCPITGEISPHHALTFSDVCYRISKNINRHILDHLGVDEFVMRTVRKGILDVTTLEGIRCKDVYRYIRRYVKDDWKMDGMTDTALRAVLEASGKRKIVVDKYRMLSGQK